MAPLTRIGEILLRHELVDPRTLMRAISELAAKKERLVSMLIKQALIDFDDGCMALSEQLGYPAALERHFERRDASLAKAISPDVSKRWAVVPIARTRSGALVLCARDPSPALAVALRRELGVDVELAIAPAIHIERLVRTACGAPPDEHSAEVPSVDEPPPTIWRRRSISGLLVADPTPRPAPVVKAPPPAPVPEPAPNLVLEIDEDSSALDEWGILATAGGGASPRAEPTNAAAAQPQPHVRSASSRPTPPAANPHTRKTISFALLEEPVEETTVGLPPTRAPAPGRPPPPSADPPTVRAPATPSSRSPDPETVRAPATKPGVPSPASSAREIEHALSRATADQLVIKHAATHWKSALLVTITGDTALGSRGHGVRLQHVEKMSLRVASSSLLRLARETASVTMATSQGPTPDQLIDLVGLPAAAAPVIVEQQMVVAILVVGQPATDFGAAMESLPILADALAAAYRRFPKH